MTAPNLLSPTTITGKTAVVSLTTTSATDILINSSGSNKCLKVNSLIVANVDGTNAADITIKLFNSASVGTGYAIASTVSVPADASLVVIDRASAIYLEEDRRLQATAGTASDLEIIISYEEIA